MEEHRLREMPKDYSVNDFNRLYEETKGLRINLARSIDPKVLGFGSYKEIESELDVKLIFAFSKYQGQYNYEVMKGHVIRALQLYKNRLLKVAATQKFQTIRNTDPLDNHLYLYDTQESREREDKIDRVMGYMKRHLSKDAFLVFCADMDAPIYIKNRLEELGKKVDSKIPAGLIAEYFGWGDDNNALQKVSKLRSEVKREITLAIEFFNP